MIRGFMVYFSFIRFRNQSDPHRLREGTKPLFVLYMVYSRIIRLEITFPLRYW